MSRSAALARMSPRTPPSPVSRVLSINNCDANLGRVAPKAILNAISFCRTASRARIKVITLAQAIKSTNTTAPKRIRSTGRSFAAEGFFA